MSERFSDEIQHRGFEIFYDRFLDDFFHFYALVNSIAAIRAMKTTMASPPAFYLDYIDFSIDMFGMTKSPRLDTTLSVTCEVFHPTLVYA